MNYREIAPEPVQEQGATGAEIRWLITAKDGATNFAMRLFEIAPGGFTPAHSHPWEHEVFVLGGKGSVTQEGSNVAITAGDFVFIPPGEKHQFKNDGSSVLSLICVIPIQKR